MLGMNAPPPFGLARAPPDATFCGSLGLPAGSEALRRRLGLPAPPQLQGQLFGSFEESLLARAEALADLAPSPGQPDAAYRAVSSRVPCPPAGLDGGDLLEPLSPPLLGGPEAGALLGPPPPPCPEAADPRELEAFAERFKQRRIRLGVTQADVGEALARLQLPGVGALSQSTICRFESLTLSPNNMRALRPALRAWLLHAEEAAAAARQPPAGGPFPAAAAAAAERKRKRTSIAAPEKRSLEAFFALQPRPSADKIAAIAHKLDLHKNVVRVWFCNQRQKQKRMKYSAAR